jgi:hypothetical protein
MKTFAIKINGKYFSGVNYDEFYSRPTGDNEAWYMEPKEVNKLVFGKEPYKIEGNRNLKSYIDRIFNAERENYIDIKKMEVINV